MIDGIRQMPGWQLARDPSRIDWGLVWSRSSQIVQSLDCEAAAMKNFFIGLGSLSVLYGRWMQKKLRRRSRGRCR